MLKKIIFLFCYLFIIGFTNCENSENIKPHIPMIEGFNGVYIGMSVKELLKVRQGLDFYPMHKNRNSNKENLEQGTLCENIKEADFYKLNLYVSYDIKKSSLYTFMILCVSEEPIFRLYQEKILTKFFELWGQNYNKKIIKLNGDDNYKTPFFLWEKDNVFIGTYASDKLKKGKEVFALIITGDKNLIDTLTKEQ